MLKGEYIHALYLTRVSISILMPSLREFAPPLLSGMQIRSVTTSEQRANKATVRTTEAHIRSPTQQAQRTRKTTSSHRYPVGRASSIFPSAPSPAAVVVDAAGAPAPPPAWVLPWLLLLSPSKTAEGGWFLTAEAASDAACVTNSLMMSLSVTGDEAIIIIVSGRRSLRVLNPAAAPAAVVDDATAAAGLWRPWRPCGAGVVPPRQPPLPSPPPALAKERTTLLLGMRMCLLATGDERGARGVTGADKNWNSRPARPLATLLLLPLPLLFTSPLPPPLLLLLRRPPRVLIPPLAPLLGAREAAPAAGEDGKGWCCTVAVATAAAAVVVAAAAPPPPPRQDASATADRTGVARIV